jgi:O-methyltransferase
MGMTERLRALTAAAMGDPDARYLIAERVAARLHNEAVLGDPQKDWLRDADFLRAYQRFEPRNPRRMERAWTAMQIARWTADLPGDTAECGVFQGLTSWLMCRENADRGKAHHVFDSFQGISSPGELDGEHWHEGDLSAAEPEVRSNLAAYDFVHYHAGWIPARFPDVETKTFSLVHVDVDLYDPTKDSLEFFWPRMVTGGVILMDDYGYGTCPGARRAADQLAARENVTILELSSGQGILQAR